MKNADLDMRKHDIVWEKYYDYRNTETNIKRNDGRRF